jgi:hypothetical protein
MDTRINEVADRVCRLSTFVPHISTPGKMRLRQGEAQGECKVIEYGSHN